MLAAAQADPPSPWSFSGFGTVGMVNKSGASNFGFVRNSTQIGADASLSAVPDSRLGGQINWNAGDRWEGAIQGVLLPKPSGAPHQEIIQQAYLGYRPLPNTRVRLGRTSPDIFLFSDSRNVGYAFPFARPPADFYGFAPLASVDGVDLEQRWNVGGSTWRARTTFGSFRTTVTDIDGSRIEMRARNIIGAGLSRERDGLLVKLSYWRGQLDLKTGPDVAALQQGLDALKALPIPGLRQSLEPLGQNLWSAGATSYLALATQYERGPWTLIAEGSRLKVPGSPLNARRGYVSVGWRNNDITYFGIASRVKPDAPAASEPELASSLAPVIGANAAQQAQALAGFAAYAGNNYRYDQSTVGAGLRWDFAPSAALKFQVDRFNIRQHGGAGWRYYDGGAAKGTLVSVLVDFVWGQ